MAHNEPDLSFGYMFIVVMIGLSGLGLAVEYRNDKIIKQLNKEARTPIIRQAQTVPVPVESVRTQTT